MQTGEYKQKQTKRFPLALITVQLGEFMVGSTLTLTLFICIDRKYNRTYLDPFNLLVTSFTRI